MALPVEGEGVALEVDAPGHPNTPSLFSRLSNRAYAAYCFFSFAHVGCLLDEGEANTITEFSAKKIQPDGCNPEVLTRSFRTIYQALAGKGHKMDVERALIKQEWSGIVATVLWIAAETSVRLGAPFALREFLIWLDDYRNDKAEFAEGWLWGGLLALSSFLLMLTHHRMFWTGIFTGFRMRTSLLSALHEKLLRLNSSSVARITTGHIINLASNDMRRFDYAVPFAPYLFFAPFETVFVLVAVTMVLGFVPAIAGMACLLLIIPSQVILSSYVAKCRAMTANVTDKRINLTGELIAGCLAVKMLGWEDPLIADVNGIRAREHKLLMLRSYIKGANLSIPNISRAIVVCVTFSTYRFTNGEFNMPDVFFALSLMMLPRLSMAVFLLLAVEYMSEALVASRRMDAFFKIPETPLDVDGTRPDDRGTIVVHNGNYGWYDVQEDGETKGPRNTLLRILSKKKSIQLRKKKAEESLPPKLRQTLADIDFTAHPGELIGIAGMVGSGKSSLLSALLNDMEPISGSEGSRISGKLSFCSQIPWIMAGTVRENILFGRAFEEELYKEVIQSCALDIDFTQFPDGDNTELGERGINISGGQKARLALARAAYSQADVHLLDDPLSAVDPRVGRILFDKCIGPSGTMKRSTRLLVTHHRQFLPLCDRVILMNDGRIEAIGEWKELADHRILKTIEKQDTHPQISLDAPDRQGSSSGELDEGSDASPSKDVRELNKNRSNAHNDINDNTRPDQLVEDEGKEAGKVKLGVYWAFARHVGIIPFIPSVLILSSSTVFSFLGEWWVARWATADTDDQEELKWVWVLIGTTVLTSVTQLVALLSLYMLFVIASTRLHEQMLRRVLHSPLKFFHTNPTGRILNRFAKDQGLQDEELPFIALDTFINVLLVVGTFVLVSIALPYMLIFFVAVTWIFARVRRRYVTTSREIKRFDGLTRSPVYAMLSSNIKGLPTIRAYGKEAEFQDDFMKALDLNGSWWAAFLSTSRWVGFRMDGISFLVMLFSVISALLLAKDVPPEVLGLALTYNISLSGMLQWTMRQTAELENTMTAVERNMEYTRLEQEPPRVADGGGEAPKGWPSKGNIEYNSVTASYRPGLEPVLKKLSFAIPGGSSVGIVGRTGSGKSSLLLTLFRLIDVGEGTVSIDGVDAASIGIDVLRKQLAVIPQDPVLFGGTLRSNLDPWSEHSDARVWDVLQKVCLDAVAKNVGGLDAPIAECGSNLSVGQRQLLCLARALLSNARILALDEATANVDRTTDALIQRSLHSLTTEKDKTLLIIAHRIDTVLDCDLLLVLEQGELVEFGSPNALLSRSEGVFAGMVEAAKKASNIDSAAC